MLNVLQNFKTWIVETFTCLCVLLSTPIQFIIFFCSLFTGNLMLECLHFSPTVRSLYDDE